MKINKSNIYRQRPLFHPTFGSRPAQIVGRDSVLQTFFDGLSEPVGSRNRCMFLIGQRGMGKTALLLEMADRAQEYDMIPALVTAYDGMSEEIIEIIQRKGSAYADKPSKSVNGFDVGALGFSFGLTFSEDIQKNYGFRTKLTILCDALSAHGKGILLLVDEVTSSEAVRQLSITYQHLVGEEKNIAIVMAGLPQAVSSILNDKVLTFLNRAVKEILGPISYAEIRAYYAKAFRESEMQIADPLIDTAAKAAEGYPYMMQLIGYYLLRYAEPGKPVTENLLLQAIQAASSDLEENVFAPVLAPLSDQDLMFLKAAAKAGDTAKISEISRSLGWNNSKIQPYRARMIGAGILESPRKGELVFAVPYLAEYLRRDRQY